MCSVSTFLLCVVVLTGDHPPVYACLCLCRVATGKTGAATMVVVMGPCAATTGSSSRSTTTTTTGTRPHPSKAGTGREARMLVVAPPCHPQRVSIGYSRLWMFGKQLRCEVHAGSYSTPAQLPRSLSQLVVCPTILRACPCHHHLSPGYPLPPAQDAGQQQQQQAQHLQQQQQQQQPQQRPQQQVGTTALHRARAMCKLLGVGNAAPLVSAEMEAAAVKYFAAGAFFR